MQPRERAIWVLLLLACGFTVISFHLIQIQLVEHGRFWRLAVENHLRPETIAPRRGTIFDSDGNVLAETQEVYDVRLDGKLVAHPATDLPHIAAALQIPAGSLIQAFRPKDRDQLLAVNVDDRAVARLKDLHLNCFIPFKQHGQRSYPNSELAAHVLGFVDGDEHGLAGVEKQMDRALTGEPGVRWVELDGKSREIAGYQARETPAVDGDDVTLTIHLSIQHIVEEELDQIVQNYHPANAYIIVMDPKTGQIMAMGSRPNFDPNDHRTMAGTATQEHCITDTVEPGSIFKIITLAAALNEGLVTLDTPIYCENGSFMFYGKELRDDEPFGTLPVEEVLAKSSNIGFAKIALNYVHEENLYKYAVAFGIGQRTGLFADQGESPGIFRPVDKWSALSITRIPMGQEVAATPLQMTDAMCAVANGGKLMAPQIIDHVTGADGEVVRQYRPRVIRQVISPETAEDVIKALHQVTVDGTAKDIHIRGYASWAGKTGTAQKFVDGAYSHTQHVSSFLGFLPAENPGFVALVMIDSPHTRLNQDYGAEVSGPVFADMAPQIAQVLNIPPDLPATAPALSAATPTTPSL